MAQVSINLMDYLPSGGEIPRVALTGSLPRYRTVRSIFLNATMYRLLQKIYQSYLDRSELPNPPNLEEMTELSLMDENGHQWIQLAPSTYTFWKRGYDEQFGLGNFIRQKRGQRGGAILHEELNARRMDIQSGMINIRSGRLLRSFFPGPISNGRLYTTGDQHISSNRRLTNVRFHNLTIPYAQDIETGPRPIIYEGMIESFMPDAVAFGYRRAFDEYMRVRPQRGNNSRRNTRGSRRR